MIALNSEQYTLLEKMKKLLPHIPEAVIQERITGADTSRYCHLSSASNLAEIQLAWHNAPEGTSEHEQVQVLWEMASQRAFDEVLIKQKSCPDGLDDFINSLRKLLYTTPSNGMVRRNIVGYLVTLLQ